MKGQVLLLATLLPPLPHVLFLPPLPFSIQEAMGGAVEASRETEMGAPNNLRPEPTVSVGLVNGPVLSDSCRKKTNPASLYIH